MFNILGCSACCRPCRVWVTFSSFSTIFEVFMLSFYLCCTHCIVPESLLNHPVVSAEECSSLMQSLMQIHCCTRSVILKGLAMQYTCLLKGIYHPHWLVQWSHHCSCLCIPVHSPGLAGYINVAQTILIMLTMAGLFLERPCIFFG